MALPPNQARFVEEYLVDLNATQAAVRAGYSAKTAKAQGSRLLTNAVVAAAIEAAKAARAARVGVTQDEVLLEMKRLAMVDIGQAFKADGSFLPLHEMPEDVRRAISGIEVNEMFAGGGEEGRVKVGELKKVKFWDKKGALDSLAKHLGMFIERYEHQHTHIVVGDPYAEPKK